jgi:oligopeptidase A
MLVFIMDSVQQNMEDFKMPVTQLESGLLVPDWDKFDPAPIIPALESLYVQARTLADEVAKMPEPSFDDLVNRFENIDEEVSRLTGPLSHQFSTRKKDWPNLKEVADRADELSVEHASFMIAHSGLYEANLRFRNSKAFTALADDEKHIITKNLESWEREGVALPQGKQSRVAEIRKELKKLSSDFGDNVVSATDAWRKYFPDSNGLEGLLYPHLQMLAAHAKEFGEANEKEGYLLSLQPAHYMTIMEYADDPSLREEVWKAHTSRASDIGPNAGEWDNGPLAVRILELNRELSELLGYSSYNDYSIADKMVKSVGVLGVEAFQAKVAGAARAKAASDWAEIAAFAKEKLNQDHLEVWDIGRVSRMLRESRFSIDEEEVRKYFPASLVWAGLAERLNHLFGVTFAKADSPLPHPSAEFYEVRNSAGEVIAGFYADLFSRDGKKGGAWMEHCMYRRLNGDSLQYPIAFLVCNFRPPIPGKEATFSHDDLTTLCHEAGHVFHHLLGQTRYIGTSMGNVEWDAIELPSQYLEELCYDPVTLISMSAHEDTGEKIPANTIDALRSLRHFGAGLAYARQSVFGIFDWRAYKQTPRSSEELIALYINTHNEFNVFPASPFTRIPTAFTHIFAGGYSAGYFSYLWAEGLVADVKSAFEEAREEGGEDAERETFRRYQNEILAVGAERPIAESFRIFRGRDLDPEKLIKHLGLE